MRRNFSLTSHTKLAFRGIDPATFVNEDLHQLLRRVPSQIQTKDKRRVVNSLNRHVHGGHVDRLEQDQNEG